MVPGSRGPLVAYSNLAVMAAACSHQMEPLALVWVMPRSFCSPRLVRPGGPAGQGRGAASRPEPPGCARACRGPPPAPARAMRPSPPPASLRASPRPAVPRTTPPTSAPAPTRTATAPPWRSSSTSAAVRSRARRSSRHASVSSHVSPHLGLQRPMATNGELLEARDDSHVPGLAQQLLANLDHPVRAARVEQ